MKVVKMFWSEEQLKFLHRVLYEKKSRTVSEIIRTDDEYEKKQLRKEEDRCRRIDSKIAKGLMKLMLGEQTEEAQD